MADADNRTCKKCAELKPISEFPTRKMRGGHRSPAWTCRVCENHHKNIYKKNRAAVDPIFAERTRESNRKARARKDPQDRKFDSIRRTYGITRDQYISMMLAQDFRCPVCANPVEASKWVVDHCHETGKVRGLLDQNCNTLLGKAYDNIATLSRAQVYLEVNGG